MVCVALSVCGGVVCADGVQDSAGVLSASDAFVRLPAKTLDLLTTSMRKDMLDYYRNDSIYKVKNAMEGESCIIAPVTQDYLKVQVTPVTTLTVRVLPTKREPLVMTVYTVGDSLQAHDSDIRFYDASMKEQPRDRYIKLASTVDFIDGSRLNKSERNELESLVPFPTVEYGIGPDSTTMTANLTVGRFMSKEDMEKLSPYLDRTCVYRWTGGKFIKDRNR